MYGINSTGQCSGSFGETAVSDSETSLDNYLHLPGDPVNNVSDHSLGDRNIALTDLVNGNKARQLSEAVNRAIKGGDLEGLRGLVESEALITVDIINGHGRNSPIWTAVNCENLDIVRFLIEHGAPVDKPHVCRITTDSSFAAIFMADLTNGSCADKADAVEISFFRGNDTPLYEACKTGNLDVVKFLVDNGALVEGSGNIPPLCAAAGEGHESVVCYLLEKGAPVSGKNGYSPLKNAYKNGHMNVVSLLKKWGAESEDQLENTAQAEGHQGSLSLPADEGDNDEISDLQNKCGPVAKALPPSCEEACSREPLTVRPRREGNNNATAQRSIIWRNCNIL